MPAAMLTQKPAMASTAAAMATASSPCCGTVDSGLLSSADATAAVLVTADPGGRTAASPGGTWPGAPGAPGAPEAPEADSHHCVTCAGSNEPPVRTSCTEPRSTM